eukprot:1053651-Amphidinium_carterae.1
MGRLRKPRTDPIVMNNDVVIEHIRAHHNPKAPWCPVCQMAEAPYKHQSLKRTEIGCLSIDIAGLLLEDVAKSKYILVFVWVTIVPAREGFLGPRVTDKVGELKKDIKQREV